MWAHRWHKVSQLAEQVSAMLAEARVKRRATKPSSAAMRICVAVAQQAHQAVSTCKQKALYARSHLYAFTC